MSNLLQVAAGAEPLAWMAFAQGPGILPAHSCRRFSSSGQQLPLDKSIPKKILGRQFFFKDKEHLKKMRGQPFTVDVTDIMAVKLARLADYYSDLF